MRFELYIIDHLKSDIFIRNTPLDFDEKMKYFEIRNLKSTSLLFFLPRKFVQRFLEMNK